MRNELNFYLILSVFCACFIAPGLQNFCFAQSLKSENVDSKQISAQFEKAEKPETDETIRVETNLIMNDVLVFDKEGKPVKDLQINDFIVKEDGKPQQISTFAHGDSDAFPRSIVLIIDYSGSQLPYIKTSIEAAKILVDKLNAQDRMAIVTDDVKILQDFTDDKNLLKERLESLKTSALSGKLGRSRQYSALMAVFNEMFAEEESRPIIIFQTDGDELPLLKGDPLTHLVAKEKKADFSFEDVLAATEKTRATIYPIIPGIRFFGIPEKELLERSRKAAINDETAFYGLRNRVFNPQKLKIPEKSLKWRAYFLNRQQSALSQIAQITSGVASFLEQPEQAEQVYSEILSEMNLRYLIGYYPNNQTRDGKRRKVSVELRRFPDYEIRSRKTYILTKKD